MALEITFLGHAGFVFDDGTHKVVIDPFLTGNPLAKHSPDDIECDAIVLTHGHGDHVGDCVAISKRNNAPIIAPYEAAVWAGEQGCETVDCNPGGGIDTDWGRVTFTQAHHSSSFENRYMGCACGVILKMGGATVYHCGDTGLFSDMKMLGEIYKPDIACVPIGDRYTMDPELATMAAEWIGAKVAIPIHYKTFPILKQSAAGFEPKGIEVKEIEPGGSWSFG